MRRVAVTLMLLGLALLAAAPVRADAKAVLELSQQVDYAGAPLRVRISVGNAGTEPIKNPVKAALLASFDVRVADGGALRADGRPDAGEPTRLERLAPGTFYGAVVDLAGMYSGLRKPGRYEIRWSADGVSSQTVSVRVIPKYDPSKEYVARVETDEGSFVIDFFGKTAPLATKAFVDMANSGFYDGLTFHKVLPDYYVEGGDPQGDGAGTPPFRYPADPPAGKMVAGTVLMKPVAPSPPANGCQFIVLLRPEPAWTGQATALGQVVEGLDVVRKISNLPSSQQTAKPFYKPLKEVRIRRIAVSPKPAAPPSGEARP